MRRISTKLISDVYMIVLRIMNETAFFHINFNVHDCLQIEFKELLFTKSIIFQFLYLIIPIILAIISFLKVYPLC